MTTINRNRALIRIASDHGCSAFVDAAGLHVEHQFFNAPSEWSIIPATFQALWAHLGY